MTLYLTRFYTRLISVRRNFSIQNSQKLLRGWDPPEKIRERDQVRLFEDKLDVKVNNDNYSTLMDGGNTQVVLIEVTISTICRSVTQSLLQSRECFSKSWKTRVTDGGGNILETG